MHIGFFFFSPCIIISHHWLHQQSVQPPTNFPKLLASYPIFLLHHFSHSFSHLTHILGIFSTSSNPLQVFPHFSFPIKTNQPKLFHQSFFSISRQQHPSSSLSGQLLLGHSSLAWALFLLFLNHTFLPFYFLPFKNFLLFFFSQKHFPSSYFYYPLLGTFFPGPYFLLPFRGLWGFTLGPYPLLDFFSHRVVTVLGPWGLPPLVFPPFPLSNFFLFFNHFFPFF